MSYDVVEVTLGGSVAADATFTVDYPSNRDAGDYQGGREHKAYSMAYGEIAATYSFGTAEVTVTNKSGVTLAADTKIWVQLDRLGRDEVGRGLADPDKMVDASVIVINLGAPDTADADGAVASQAATAADGLATGINGALASGGVATFDVPRNVVAAWTTTAVLTVTGTDAFGNTIVESSASGTSMTGKKAFKTITDIAVSVDVTGLTVGNGDVLGIPVFLPSAGMVLKELQDGAAATAGTLVAGVATNPATATTGDVRGTYDPNAACDGAKAFQLIAAIPDPTDKGVAQFAG